MADDESVVVVEYMPAGVDHWLVMRGSPGESLEECAVFLRRVLPGPVAVRERDGRSA